MKKSCCIIFGVFIFFLCFTGSLFAAEKETVPTEPMDSLVLAMSTDNVGIFDAAITIGSVALKRGHPVTMLLRVDSIKIAVAKNNYRVGETTLAKKLAAFMEAGAKVIAGGSCMKQMGLSQDDLVRGVLVGTPDFVMGTLFRKDAKILTY